VDVSTATMSDPEGVGSKRASRFLSLPSTGAGRWSAWLLVVSLVLILLNNLVVMPETEQHSSLELAQRAFNLAVFLCVAFAGVTGLFAIVTRRERSWALFVAVLLFIVAVGFNLGQSFAMS
jgi:cytochrome bd-type quinol oxidase subunit 2